MDSEDRLADERRDDPRSAYPPEVHVLRDLGLEVEVLDDGLTRGRLGPRSTRPAGATARVVPLGVVATAVDVLAGALCARTISPDWMATSVMSLQLGTIVDHDAVELTARVLRAGRSAVTVEVELAQPRSTADPMVEAPAGPADVVGAAVLTFARLPRRDSTLVLPETGGRPGDRYGFGAVADGSGRIGVGVAGFDQAIGCQVLDATSGRTTTEVSSYVRNSFGAVNGGVVAAIGDAAARSAASAADSTGDRAPGDGWQVRSLTANFLGQGRVGPVVTDAAVVLSDATTHVVRVEVADAGQPDPDGGSRVMVVAHLVLARAAGM